MCWWYIANFTTATCFSRPIHLFTAVSHSELRTDNKRTLRLTQPESYFTNVLLPVRSLLVICQHIPRRRPIYKASAQTMPVSPRGIPSQVKRNSWEQKPGIPSRPLLTNSPARNVRRSNMPILGICEQVTLNGHVRNSLNISTPSTVVLFRWL